MISLSLSNLIKNFLNIQDDNISFPEEEYCQVTQKGDYRIKVFKDFLNLITALALIVILKILLKMVQDIVKLNIFLFKITILNLSLLYKDIFVRIARKLSPLPLILSVITLIYLIILSTLLLLNLKKMYHLHILLRNMIFLLLLCKEL